MACLDENVIALHLQRRLSGPALADAERHLAECDACRALVEEMALVFAGEEAASESPVALVPGAKLGRYVVLRAVGAGAFGVVYAAFDPELDRKIALKVLRSDRDASWRDRFLHEARAMARLSHPNVTQVHDVHAEGDRLFIAMEFVEGTHLGEWLGERRSWREILRVFLSAGRGLAAAHAANLIHRDFKPANVLIGADGRVSVTDFGLAERTEARSGEVSGTPRYMAPEQFRGEAGPAADQFSFGVALEEALRENNDAPRWLRRAIGRALDPDPAKRFPSMDALLRAISVDPRDRRNRRLAIAGFALLLAAIPAARIYDAQLREARLCTGAPEKVREVWNDPIRAQLSAAFAATERPFAKESAAKVEQGFDAWFARWSVDYTDSCEATRIRGEQSDEVLTERMRCLERARTEARALIEELAHADAHAVDRAVESVRDLASLDECSDVDALLTPLAPPKKIARAVESVRETLAEARSIRNTGRHAKAMEKFERAVKAAKELDHAPTIAEAMLAIARGQAHLGRFDEAKASLREAIDRAAVGHHDRVSAEAWIELVFLSGVVGDDEEIALALSDAARAAVARIRGHPELTAKLDSTIGLLLAAKGRYPESIARHRAALAAWERAYGKRALEAGLEHHRLSEVLLASGEIAAAEDHASRSQDILRDAYGANHPIMALPLAVLAEIACERKQFVECGRRIERAIALRASNGTPLDHPTFVPKRLLLVRALQGAGRHEEARRELEALSSLREGVESTEKRSTTEPQRH